MLSLLKKTNPTSEIEAILEARMSFNQAYAEFLGGDTSLEEKETEFLPDCPQTYLSSYHDDFTDKEAFYQSMGHLYHDDYIFYKGLLETINNNKATLENALVIIYLIIIIKTEVMYPKYRHEAKQNSDKYFELSSYAELKSLIRRFFLNENKFESKLLNLIDSFEVEYEKDKQTLHFNTSKKVLLSVICSNQTHMKAWEDLIVRSSITGLLIKDDKKCTNQEKKMLERYQAIRAAKERNETLYNICNNLVNQKLGISVASNTDLGQIAVFVHGLMLEVFDARFIKHLQTIQKNSGSLKQDILKLKQDLKTLDQKETTLGGPKKNTSQKKKKKRKKRNVFSTDTPDIQESKTPNLQESLKKDEATSEQEAEALALRLEALSLKQKTLLLAYQKPMPFDRSYVDSTDEQRPKRVLETLFARDYPIKLDEIIGVIKGLGGQVKTNGSGSNHYRIKLAGHIADFCHKHKPGSTQRRISAISKRIIFDVLNRAGIFEQHQADVEYNKLAPASHRRFQNK